MDRIHSLEKLTEMIKDSDNMAEKEKSPIEILLDQDNDENIKLYDEKNNCVEFEQVAIIPIDEKIYAILRPVSGIEGIGEDEALVFGIEEVDDEDCLIVVDDDAIVDQVFEQYYKLLKDEGVEV